MRVSELEDEAVLRDEEELLEEELEDVEEVEVDVVESSGGGWGACVEVVVVEVEVGVGVCSGVLDDVDSDEVDVEDSDSESPMMIGMGGPWGSRFARAESRARSNAGACRLRMSFVCAWAVSAAEATRRETERVVSVFIVGVNVEMLFEWNRRFKQV